MAADPSMETDLTVIDEWPGGIGWLAYPEEDMQRAGHAFVVDGDVWLVDPVDAAGLDDRLGELGTVAGVVVCIARHERDAVALARHHDVPVYLPEPVADSLSLPVQTRTVADSLPGTGYEVLSIVDNPVVGWQEAALFDREDGTLYVPESLGTSVFFCTGTERLGVHPVLRPVPPRRALGGLSPERLLVGHAEGVMDDAEATLQDALSGARRRLPSLYLQNLRLFIDALR